MVAKQSITLRYPARNPAWIERVDEDGWDGEYAAEFVAELSSLNHPTPAAARDPWNRPMPGVAHPVFDREGEIVKWTAVTTVDGQPVLLIILND